MSSSSTGAGAALLCPLCRAGIGPGEASLRAHLSGHLNYQPYSCPSCRATFAVADDALRHAHHQRHPFGLIEDLRPDAETALLAMVHQATAPFRDSFPDGLAEALQQSLAQQAALTRAPPSPEQPPLQPQLILPPTQPPLQPLPPPQPQPPPQRAARPAPTSPPPPEAREPPPQRDASEGRGRAGPETFQQREEVRAEEPAHSAPTEPPPSKRRREAKREAKAEFLNSEEEEREPGSATEAGPGRVVCKRCSRSVLDNNSARIKHASDHLGESEEGQAIICAHCPAESAVSVPWHPSRLKASHHLKAHPGKDFTFHDRRNELRPTLELLYVECFGAAEAPSVANLNDSHGFGQSGAEAQKEKWTCLKCQRAINATGLRNHAISVHRPDLRAITCAHCPPEAAVMVPWAPSALRLHTMKLHPGKAISVLDRRAELAPAIDATVAECFDAQPPRPRLITNPAPEEPSEEQLNTAPQEPSAEQSAEEAAETEAGDDSTAEEDQAEEIEEDAAQDEDAEVEEGGDEDSALPEGAEEEASVEEEMAPQRATEEAEDAAQEEAQAPPSRPTSAALAGPLARSVRGQPCILCGNQEPVSNKRQHIAEMHLGGDWLLECGSCGAFGSGSREAMQKHFFLDHPTEPQLSIIDRSKELRKRIAEVKAQAFPTPKARPLRQSLNTSLGL